jgi:uncharacterized membrane protein YfcA
MVAYALTVLIGVSLGALGAGGAILMLPMLVYVAGFAPQDAVAMSLAVMAATSIVGAAAYVRRGDFSLRLAVVFGLGGMAGAYAGSWFTRMVAPQVLMLLFGGLLLFVGVQTLRDKQALTCSDPCLPPRCFLIAAAIGLLTGFLGVGGGFLLVPALMRFAGLEHRSAVGTSLALIGVNSIAGLAGQLRHGRLDWMHAAYFVAFALTGVFAGFLVARRAPPEALKTAFGWLLVVIGAGVTVSNAVGMT